MLLALTSGQKTGLVVMGAVFIIFALISAMLVPRYRPDFPGRYLRVFIAICVLFTAGMLATVVFGARESIEPEAAKTEETQPPATPTKPAPSETTPPAETTETTTTEGKTTTEAAPTTTQEQAQGNAAAGEQVFKTAGCTSCHTLSAAGSTGTIGPNLDQAQPSYDKVVERVTEGKGVMPSFKNTLTPQQIQDVAAYVSSASRS